MKYWEIIADNLSKAGWSWGCVATVDASGRTICVSLWHTDETLTAFMELESRGVRAAGTHDDGRLAHLRA